jgi:transcriptional regulator with GAF, ATPase, and Fis domain
MYLESAPPDAVEQEIRHALKRLATDVNHDEADLAVFELDGGTPRCTHVLTTEAAGEHTVAHLANERWILDKAAALEPVLITRQHDDIPTVPTDKVHSLWSTGIRAVVAASWKTRYAKIATAILCFRGGREENTAFAKARSSVLDFARRVGALLLVRGNEARSEPAPRSIERDRILRILASTSWRIEGPRGAARALGLKPSTLRSRLQKLSIRRAS